MIDFQHGDLVRLEDDDGPVTDEQGRVLDGMTGRLDRMTPFYAYVALTCWPGVTVRVLRRSLVLVDPRPQTKVQWRAGEYATELSTIERTDVSQDVVETVAVVTEKSGVKLQSTKTGDAAFVVKHARKPKRRAPRMTSSAPPETIYPEPVAPAPRPLSRLREKLAALSHE